MACVTSAGAPALADRPRIWNWEPTLGGAAHDPAFLPLVRMYPLAGESGTSMAQRLVTEIRRLQLGAGEIGVILHHYGRSVPPLAYDPADAAVVPSGIAALASGTPWMSNGLPKAKAWTDAFIAEYRRLQIELGVPSPHRFHMDSELRLPKLCYQSAGGAGLDDCWGIPPLQLFDAIALDARWSIERVPVSEPSGVVWRTLKELHDAAGAPAWDSTQPRSAVVNQSWSRWFDGMQRSVMEGAFETALYGPVRNAWPDCKSSEFAQSLRVDGQVEPGGGLRVFRDFEWWLNGWMESAWHGAGDLQTPTLYAFGTTFMVPGSDWVDANIRLDRGNLDACLHSYGGADPSTITPWIMLPGVQLPIGPMTWREADASMLQERMSMLRWRGIGEFQTWGIGTTASAWTGLVRAVDAVWSSMIVDVVLAQGSCADPARLAAVQQADRDAVELQAGSAGIELRIRVQGVDGAAGPCARDRVLVHAECSGTPGTLRIEAARAGDPAAGWLEVVSAPVVTDGSVGLHRSWIESAAECVRADGSVLMRLSTDSASLRVDLFRCARFADPGPDLDGSGSVDTGDLAMALIEFGPSAGGHADLDGSGAIDFGDLALILIEFGACDG